MPKAKTKGLEARLAGKATSVLAQTVAPKLRVLTNPKNNNLCHTIKKKARNTSLLKPR